LIRKRVLFGALFLLLFVLGWWAGRGGAAGGLYGNLDLFVEVLQKVDQNYVDPVEPEKLLAGAMRGMLRDLDPYSQYLDARSYERLQGTTHGAFGGIGIVVGIRDNYPTVISPIEGTPAWEAGMRSGDVIVSIEGAGTAGLSVEEISDRLRGPEGTAVKLSIERAGEGEPLALTLTRRTIRTRSVPYAFMAEPGVGYVRLADFAADAGDELRAALAALRRQGARAYVLDLRLNPGGLLDQAVAVTGQFVPKGSLVVYTEGRARGADVRQTAADPRPDVSAPLVVLVDGGSASAAEIVAGALQDLDRALVIGHTSFGKGSVQSVYPLPAGGGALKLTTALYHTPSGRSIHRRSASAAEEDAEDVEDAEAADGAPHDSSATAAPAPRPRFRTRAGRVVFGGGGITPDLAVEPDSLPPLVASAERRGLPFRFASRWMNGHAGLRDAADAAALAAFEASLRADTLGADPAALAAARPQLARALRRELARRIDGDAGAARVALEVDPVFQRALAAVRRARVPRDVFAGLPAADAAPLAATPAPAPAAAKR
jgi:carboxyl-terminal processing protease